MEIVGGVHRLGTSQVNYYLISDGGGLTLVDAGLPAYYGQLEIQLSAMGRSVGDIEAIVLTHAHADHLGFNRRVQREGAALHVHRDDAAPGTRRFPPLHLYADPRSWPWLRHGLLTGLLKGPDVVDADSFGDGAVLDVPGQPMVVHVPGHTRGSCAFVLNDRGVVFSGDALVTFDPYTRRRGPQLMVAGVNEDAAQARTSLERLAGLDAQVLLPGHGDPWTQGMLRAVELARTAA